MATRWGILGAGLISEDFVTGVQLLPTTDHQVVAVAARKLDSAKSFADRFKVPKAFSSYEEVCKQADVDVVYIGVIHPYHKDLALMALNSGKHVLCEKPLGMNAREVKEILALAKEKGRFFMEAFWSRFFPAYDRLRQSLREGVVGTPKVVHAQFGFSGQAIDRLTKPELGGGALLDVGCYTIQMADLVFGGRRPEKIQATANLLDTGVDGTTVLTLSYPGGGLAVLTCSVQVELSNTATIQGSDGIIQMPRTFWSPDELVVKGESFTFPLPECPQPLNFANSQGFSYEAQHVREMLIKGALESPLMTHESSQIIADIMTEARAQLGVVYPADNL